MSTLNNTIYHYQNGDQECIRIGGTGANGVQICTGKFTFSRAASVKLNTGSDGAAGIYTGYQSSDTATMNFAKAFSEKPVVLVAPKGNNYWLGDVVADTSGITRLDVYTNARFVAANNNPLSVTFEYVAIGKAGTDTSNMTTYSGKPMWKNNCVQIPYKSADGKYSGIQICTGSYNASGVSISSAVNSSSSLLNIYTARPSITNGTFDHAFTAAPRIFAAPSLACQNWLQSNTNKFDHTYWFGSTTPSTSGVTYQRVFSNKSHSHGVYGRYIAIGHFERATSTSGWSEVSTALENGDNGACLRFNSNSGTGLQLCYGTFSTDICDMINALNDMDDSIYTGFRNGPCLFPKPFSGSPTVVAIGNQACRNSNNVFLHPYWFGDAAANSIGIMNLDAYTNLPCGNTLSGQYIAAGQYDASMDNSAAYQLVSKAAEFIDVRNYPGSVSYLGVPYNGLTLAQGTLLSYSEHSCQNEDEEKWNPQVVIQSNGKVIYYSQHALDKAAEQGKTLDLENTTGWCSEFASEMAHGTADEDIFPRAASFEKFSEKLQAKSLYHEPNRSSGQLLGTFDGIVPSMGDLLFINENDDDTVHTCLVINVNGSYANTIEGNISLVKGTKARDRSVYFRRRRIEGTDSLNVRGIGHIIWQ